MSTDKIRAQAESKGDQVWKHAEELQLEMMMLSDKMQSYRGTHIVMTPREVDIARFAMSTVIAEVFYRKGIRTEESLGS